MDVETVKEALDVLMDGDWMRTMDHHNAHMFPPAIAEAAKAARAWVSQTEHAPRIWVYQTSRLSGTFAVCNPEDADGYVILVPLSPGGDK